jgi:hypothetical protein
MAIEDTVMGPYRLSEIDTVSASVGKIILFWGAIEAHLSGLCLVLLHPLNKPPPHDGVPVAFSRKIKTLRCCYRTNPRMSAIKDEAYSLLSGLRPLHLKRNTIVHGYYQGINTSDQNIFTVYHKAHGKEPAWRWHYYTADELATVADNMLNAETATKTLTSKTHSVSAQIAG